MYFGQMNELCPSGWSQSVQQCIVDVQVKHHKYVRVRWQKLEDKLKCLHLLPEANWKNSRKVEFSFFLQPEVKRVKVMSVCFVNIVK